MSDVGCVTSLLRRLDRGVVLSRWPVSTGTTVGVMWGSVPQIDDRVVVDDDLGVVIVSRETIWC